jgi:hypothetical protein
MNRSSHLANVEGLTDFERDWLWASPHGAGALTAVLRVKNEALNLPFVLPPLLRSVDRVVLVDNQSTDTTAADAARIAAQSGLTERLSIVEYPFEISRCGGEHLATVSSSVHSLTYFNNWCFSHVETSYGMKFDGDMVLSEDGERVLRDLCWRLEAADVVVRMCLTPVWLRSDRVAYINLADTHREPWGWPNRPGFVYMKGFEWEIPLRPLGTPLLDTPIGVCFEVKRLDVAEFDHWTTSEDFIENKRYDRERRTWETLQSMLAGVVPPGFIEVVAPDGTHVLDVIRSRPRREWATLYAEDERLRPPTLTTAPKGGR